ncbi:hypothetical protein ACS5NO_17615 [Larkinella sp. GY13]|uniref:hypothetical protein n=1 Tax=Larkinella sp. GY13 TaxID=3453720 RepID=UPI003EEC3728
MTTESMIRAQILAVAQEQIGVVEKRNRNDHPKITEWNKALGLPANSPYCASGIYYCYAANGIRLPIRSPGLVRSWFSDGSKIVYRRSQCGNTRTGRRPRLADPVSIFESHVELLAQERWDEDEDEITVIGFNTTAGPGSKGGVYRVRRKLSQVKLIANHLTPYLEKNKPRGL